MQRDSHPHGFEAKGSVELARLCSLDVGREVTPDEVRGWCLVGESALARFTDFERQEIATTLLKELAYG